MLLEQRAESLLEKLVHVGRPGTGMTTTITEQEIFAFLLEMKGNFMKQPVMLELNPPLTIVGDIHGQLADLIRMFQNVGWPPRVNYLFLGDYVDRGQWSVETVLFLFCIKAKYSNNFFLLRGNHETRLVNRIYGLYDDIIKRWHRSMIFDAINEVFDWMPLTALISKKILCMHGGLSSELYNAPSLDILTKPARPCHDPPSPSLANDLLWADPDITTKGFKQSIRGCSSTFGADIVTQFCKKNNLDLIVRAHQVVQDGYDFFANRKLVTIFSAPHYCGQFDNAAAVMIVSEDLVCSFRILRPAFPNAIKKKEMSNTDVTVMVRL